MNANDNYPPGAANDPLAPWNQTPDEEFTRRVTVTISFDYTTPLPESACEEYVKDSISEDVFDLCYDNSISRDSHINNFDVDEIEVE